MSDGPEIETNELRESLHEMQEEREEREKQEKQDAWTRYIAVTTAMLAVVAAVASLQAGSLANEALIDKQKAAIAQAQASDTWAEYQADNIKALIRGATADVLVALGKSAPVASDLKKKQAAEAIKQKKLMADAKDKEDERDKADKDSEGFLHRHESFALVVTLTQVSIALSAVAALTRRQYIWVIGMILGFVGLVLFIWNLIQR